MDLWIKTIARSGNLRATAIIAPDLVNEVQRRHALSTGETKYLGEAFLASILLASTAKTGERLSLSVKGNAFLRQAVVDVIPGEGVARGFVIAKELEKDIDVNLGPWQEGTLTVVRNRPGEKEPYVGTVPLVTGHLAKDLTFYLHQSEQIPSACGIVVNMGENRQAKSAGGFLVQVLPGATDAEIKLVEKNINTMDALAEQVASHEDPVQVLAPVFGDLGFTILERKPWKFGCHCSRERVTGALTLLGRAELQDMLDKDGGASVRCDFCATEYKFSYDELKAIISK